MPFDLHSFASWFVPLCHCAFVPLYVNDATYFHSYVTDIGINSLTFEV
jgi:hypothetical protein